MKTFVYDVNFTDSVERTNLLRKLQMMHPEEKWKDSLTGVKPHLRRGKEIIYGISDLCVGTYLRKHYKAALSAYSDDIDIKISNAVENKLKRKATRELQTSSKKCCTEVKDDIYMRYRDSIPEIPTLIEIEHGCETDSDDVETVLAVNDDDDDDVETVIAGRDDDDEVDISKVFEGDETYIGDDCVSNLSPVDLLPTLIAT